MLPRGKPGARRAGPKVTVHGLGRYRATDNASATTERGPPPGGTRSVASAALRYAPHPTRSFASSIRKAPGRERLRPKIGPFAGVGQPPVEPGSSPGAMSRQTFENGGWSTAGSTGPLRARLLARLVGPAQGPRTCAPPRGRFRRSIGPGLGSPNRSFWDGLWRFAEKRPWRLAKPHPVRGPSAAGAPSCRAWWRCTGRCTR